MFSRICFGLLAFCAFKGNLLGVATHGRVYVLYPGLRSWNEVQELCSRAGFGMLKIKSGRDSFQFLQHIKEWNNGGALDYDIWMGLYDHLQRKKKNVKYLWNDCTALGSYRPWAESEPDHKETEHCVRISTSGMFRTMTCGEHYHTVCQQNAIWRRLKIKRSDNPVINSVSIDLLNWDTMMCGNKVNEPDHPIPLVASDDKILTSWVCRYVVAGLATKLVRCWFNEKRVDVLKYTQIKPRSSTHSKCKQDCLSLHEEGNMCLAYRHSKGLCRIYLRSPPGPSFDTSPVKKKVALKQCYRGYINSTFPYLPENKDDFANDSCDPDTTTSSSTTTWTPSTASTTSSLSSDTTTVTSPGASASTATTHTTTVSLSGPTFHNTSVSITASVAMADAFATASTTTSSATTSSATTAQTTATTTLTPAAATFITTVTTTTTTANATTNPTVASTPPNIITSVAASSTSSTTSAMPTTSRSPTPSSPSPPEQRKDAITVVVSPLQHCHVTGTCHEVCIRVEGLYTLDVMDMLKQLLLEKNILSSYRRSKISIPDHRPSAVSIGMVGICILIGFVMSVVFMDIVRYAS